MKVTILAAAFVTVTSATLQWTFQNSFIRTENPRLRRMAPTATTCIASQKGRANSLYDFTKRENGRGETEYFVERYECVDV